MDDETRHPIPTDASFRRFQDHLIFYLNPVTNRPLFDNDPNNRGACYFMSGANVAYEFHCLNLIMQETGGTRPEAPIRTISEGLVASGLRDVAWGFINHQSPAQDVPSSLRDIQYARPDLYAGVVVPWVKYFITHLNPSNHLTTEGVLRVNVPEFESKMCAIDSNVMEFGVCAASITTCGMVLGHTAQFTTATTSMQLSIRW